ncbi:MAG: phosphatidylserine decarboxylase [Spirochaetes bacterium]|nr:phosphatidylserine decarboxylase [Spirochaetota bacterium]
MIHQYIDRRSSKAVTENIFHDRLINSIYSDVREKSPFAFRLLTSPRMSSLIACAVYDIPCGGFFTGAESFAKNLGIGLDECLEPDLLKTPRQIFERKIKYWECRPMNGDMKSIVSPADSRMLAGKLSETNGLFIKEKFFSYKELIGMHKEQWILKFRDGLYSVFRLTPDKYHWNHFPVSGTIVDYYEFDGSCHSCNPSAVIAEVTPYSKNRRAVTIIDTDVEGGTNCGFVAMFEVAALMIGGIEQRYSDVFYDEPRKIEPGMFARKGSPKSLYHPGSSVDILLFEKDRMDFSEDIKRNLKRKDAVSRYSEGFGEPLVETEVALRSEIGKSI